MNNPESIKDKLKSLLNSSLPKTETNPNEIYYNEAQTRAINMIVSGKSCVITGAAGTGKTTIIEGAIRRKMQSLAIKNLKESNHKWLHTGMYATAFVSFTNKAVQNLKKALSNELQNNCITIHKLLEFAPVIYEEFDSATGKSIRKMEFKPGRNKHKTLPHLDLIVIDECTMVGIDLWNLLADAISTTDCPQVVLVGDIHQLPPVFGKSIFIHAMQARAETVELTEVYRQAMNSPIISLAHRIKSGKQIPPPELQEFTKQTPHGNVTIRPWKMKLTDYQAVKQIQKFLCGLIDSGEYDPEQDMILTPFNKSFGTVAMNQAIAGHLAKKEISPEKKEIWEIYAGIKKVYFRIGDRVLYKKAEAQIVKIERNYAYYGKLPRIPSSTMDYAGVESDAEKRMFSANSQDSEYDVDFMLEHMSAHYDEDEKVAREASHKITLYLPDTESEIEVTSSGDINSMELGYALTVHKSQGSEYNKVFFITHGSQSIMLFRELLYTAVTRAKNDLYIICEPNMFVKGITSQRIPGNTLEEKLENFDRNMQLSKSKSAELPQRVDLILK